MWSGSLSSLLQLLSNGGILVPGSSGSCVCEKQCKIIFVAVESHESYEKEG